MPHVSFPVRRSAPADAFGRWSSSALVVAWVTLVALAVVGRLWRPEWQGTRLWNVTPFVAVALAAGALFPGRLLAASVPLVALALGNVALPGYSSPWLAAVVYAATAFPVLLGRAATRGRWPAVIGAALAGSLVFFLATNLAHWALTTDYPHTAAGLAACFTAALPFFRPLEDLAWTGIVFGGLAAADRIGAASAARTAATATATAAVSGRLD